MYPPEVLAHFKEPHNVGEVESPDAAVEVENPACGDILRLSLKVNQGWIAEARYRARGCVASIAAGSLLTELIKGQPVAEAARIHREQIVAGLGGLTNESMHASHLAIDALKAVLRQLPRSS